MWNCWQVVLMIVMSFSLSGCFYTSNFDKYADAMATHAIAESDRISSQSKAIMQTVINTDAKSPTESTLLAVIGMMQIERLHPTALNIAAPTTGMDVLKTIAGHIPFATMGLTTYKIAERGFEAAGNVILSGETLTVSDSFNQPENHATGDNNSASLASVPSTED